MFKISHIQVSHIVNGVQCGRIYNFVEVGGIGEFS
jgi:hypothetical protein